MLVGIRTSQVGCTDADGAVRAAVAVDQVVGDLQVARVGVGKDGPALGDYLDCLERSGETAKDGIEVARKSLLVATADFKAVDGGLED